MDTILIVDDDPSERALLEDVLKGGDYHLISAGNGLEAKRHLETAPKEIKAVLLDWVMSGMTGIELLQWIKQQPQLADVEVIMQSGRIAPEDVKEGIDRGAYYYLTKPFQVAQLQAILRAGVASCNLKRSLLAKIELSENAFRLLVEGRFQVRTLPEAESLAIGLSTVCDTSSRGVGLFELLVNAVEHGNLGIAYEEKSHLRERGIFESEVERRLALPENRNKRVRVDVKRGNGLVEILIEDAGPGFDYRKYLTLDEKRVFDSHGRGILLASTMLKLCYIPPGNKVRVVVPLQQNGQQAAESEP